MDNRISIVPFTHAYTNKVIDLILFIQQVEFNIPVTIEKQPDLLNISGIYQKGNGNFWIALQNNDVIGTIGLLDIGNQQGALRKMFVDKNFRGKGYRVGQQLMETLLTWADQKQLSCIYLGTTENLKAAHRFYEKNCFEQIERNKLPPRFPIMEVDTKFYKYELDKSK